MSDSTNPQPEAQPEQSAADDAAKSLAGALGNYDPSDPGVVIPEESLAEAASLIAKANGTEKEEDGNQDTSDDSEETPDTDEDEDSSEDTDEDEDSSEDTDEETDDSDDEVEDNLDDLDSDEEKPKDKKDKDAESVTVGGKQYSPEQLEQLVSKGQNYEAKAKTFADTNQERVEVEEQRDATMGALQGVLTIMDEMLVDGRQQVESAIRTAGADPAKQLALQQNLRSLSDLENKLVQAVQGVTPEALKALAEKQLDDSNAADGPVSRAFSKAARAKMVDESAMSRFISKAETKRTLKAVYGVMTNRYGMTASAAKERLANASAEDLFMFSDVLDREASKKAAAKATSKVKKPVAKKKPATSTTKTPTRGTKITAKVIESRQKYVEKNMGGSQDEDIQEFILTGVTPDGLPRYAGG